MTDLTLHLTAGFSLLYWSTLKTNDRDVIRWLLLASAVFFTIHVLGTYPAVPWCTLVYPAVPMSVPCPPPCSVSILYPVLYSVLYPRQTWCTNSVPKQNVVRLGFTQGIPMMYPYLRCRSTLAVPEQYPGTPGLCVFCTTDRTLEHLGCTHGIPMPYPYCTRAVPVLYPLYPGPHVMGKRSVLSCASVRPHAAQAALLSTLWTHIDLNNTSF